jgi:hypothetical protein
MSNALLRAAPWAALVVAAVGGIGLWLWPVGEATQPSAAVELEAPPPTAATSPVVAAREPETPPSALDVTQLTERAKQQLALDPEAALQDIAQADKLTGPGADELNETRRVIEIHALVKLGKVGLARTLTDRFYRTYPNSDRAVELERLTGYHPRPTGP